jgi:DNA-binding transcriptional MerR regulator
MAKLIYAVDLGSTEETRGGLSPSEPTIFKRRIMMAIINTKTNIPSIGDMIDKVLTSKDKKFAQLTFQSGKKVIISIDPTEFNITPNEKPVVKDVQPQKQILKKKVVTSNKVNDMTRNTPQDEDYKLKAMVALAKMQGSTPAEIKEMLDSQRQTISNQTISESGTPSDDWKEKAQAALEKSQQRASKMAEQLSAKHGGKTDTSFGGRSSIEMK